MKMLAKKTRCEDFVVRRTQRGLAALGRNQKPVLAPRRQEREEDLVEVPLRLAFLASSRET